jgi:hypothetical protein
LTGYTRCVLRRSASFVGLLAIIGAPTVTSTRFFCRHTGEEIFGCAEAGTPQHALARANQCCDQRTFHALDGVRLVDGRGQQTPAPVALDAAPLLLAELFALAAPEPYRTPAPSAGPPAFMSHRALLS